MGRATVAGVAAMVEMAFSEFSWIFIPVSTFFILLGIGDAPTMISGVPHPCFLQCAAPEIAQF